MSVNCRVSICLFSLALLSSGGLAIAADEPPAAPPKPFRPFPELPDVLFFEDYENSPTVMEKGKLHADVPCLPGGQAWLLENKSDSKTDKVVWTYLMINKTPVKVPGGFSPNQVFLSLNVWAEESGDVIIKASHKDGGYEDKVPVSKEKTWTPVLLRISDLRSKSGRPEAEHLISKFEILFKARPKPKEYPKVYIDDVVITTNGVRPMMVMPRVMMLRKVTLDLTKTTAADGYSYSPVLQEKLKTALKASGKKHKLKTVLVAGARPKDDEQLVKGLSANATKVKASGFSFVPGSETDVTDVAGLENMRTFLEYNLHQSDAEMVILMLGPDDAKMRGRPSESLRVVLARALDNGCAPIVCLPASPPGLSKGDKAKIDGFINTVSNVCLDMGVPVISSDFAVKGAATAFDKQNLNAAGIDEVSVIASQVVKQLDSFVFMRK